MLQNKQNWPYSLHALKNSTTAAKIKKKKQGWGH